MSRANPSTLRRDVFLEHRLDADRRQVGLWPAGCRLDEPIDGITCLDARILVDDGVDRAGEKEAARVLGHLVADEHGLGCAAGFIEGAGDTAIAGADVVDAGKAGIRLQERLRLTIGTIGVVPY